MASGVPVVAPAAGGSLDLIQPGIQGELYAPEVDADLRTAVARLLAKPAQRHQMSAAGRTAMLPRSWNALGEALIDHYQTTITRHATAAAPPAAAA